VLVVTATSIVGAPSASARDRWVDITATDRGRALAERAASRHGSLGVATAAAELRVWRVGRGDYIVGPSRPEGARVVRERSRGGRLTFRFEHDVVADGATAGQHHRTVAVAPAWAWVGGACFSRMGSVTLSWFDSCYQLHRLVGEADKRDFYQLHQFGTLGAGTLTKIYSGWLKAVPAPGSAPMSWIDWSPRSNKTGTCQSVTIRVEVLSVNIQSPSFFCENNIPTKDAAPGSFRMRWDCGCVFPFGQPYPNSREVEYMQAVSVPGGGAVRWTLSAGYTAR
jgi:hypothetical protein